MRIATHSLALYENRAIPEGRTHPEQVQPNLDTVADAEGYLGRLSHDRSG